MQHYNGITGGASMKENEIRVSVYMSTYNHQEYIKQALESVLSQKTNFKYEIVVGDDASTDDTQEILRRYKDKYADIMNVILRSKNIGPLKNSTDILKRCRGKYIAFLEGDDYWIDDNKLQTQIDFLDDHLEYVACFTDCKIKKDAYYPYKYAKRDINLLDDYLNKGDLLNIPTATLVCRNIFKNPKTEMFFSKNQFVGDKIRHALLLKKGKIKYIDKKMATYRYITKKGSSFSSKNLLFKNKDVIICYKVCMCIFGRKYYNEWYKLLGKQYLETMRELIKIGKPQELIKLFFIEMNIIEKMYMIRRWLLEISEG